MSAPPGEREAPVAEAAIWQQVEFGSYAADLPLWRALAEEANGPVLELGAGSGRVAAHLVEHGHQVVALERDPGLIAELERSAARLGGGPVTTVRADLASASELELPVPPALVIGPLHVVQFLDSSARPALLGRMRELIAPGGQMALTVVDETTVLSAGAAATQILPDMREVDGWVYSSEPLWVQVGDDALTVRRVRERVSPAGAIQRSIHDEVLNRVSPERLEIEAEEVGFRPTGRRQISSGPNEADSTAVLLEVPR
jgi:precorrin-6B methylase 2